MPKTLPKFEKVSQLYLLSEAAPVQAGRLAEQEAKRPITTLVPNSPNPSSCY
jgi:hypothetical protein